MRPDLVAANLAVMASTWPGWQKWRAATHQVRRAQAAVWARIRERNAQSQYGRRYGFRNGLGLAQLGDLPIMTGDDLAAANQAWREGQRDVLTSDPVIRFVPTSGTAGGRKDIPMTAALLAEFQAGIDPWLGQLYHRHPGMLRGCAYWQITPAITDTTPSTQPGQEEPGDDTEYLGPLRRAIMKRIMAVPATVAKAPTRGQFQWQTIRHLVARRDLSFISVWNPTFLTLLLDAIPDLRGECVDWLRLNGQTQRAAEVDRIFRQWSGDHRQVDAQARTWPEQLWPKLRLISCWADGNAANPAQQLHRRLPNVTLEPKGLLATEGIVSFPWRDGDSILAITSHVFEFVPDDGPDRQPRLADELAIGQRYQILLTTGAGLYRYSLGDIIQVTGYVRDCPTIRFVGRHDGVCDLVGEKVSPSHVERAVAAAFATITGPVHFWMMAPDVRPNERWGYTLYLQHTSPDACPEQLERAIELRLRDNPHYRYARDLGQLDPVRIFTIDPSADPAGIYLRRVSATRRLGSIKPPVLDRQSDWAQVFPGSFLHPRSD